MSSQVEQVMMYTGVSQEEAQKALADQNGSIIDAIAALTPVPTVSGAKHIPPPPIRYEYHRRGGVLPRCVHESLGVVQKLIKRRLRAVRHVRRCVGGHEQVAILQLRLRLPSRGFPEGLRSVRPYRRSVEFVQRLDAIGPPSRILRGEELNKIWVTIGV